MEERPPLLERLGVGVFRRFGEAPRTEPADAVHYLNPDERRALRRLQAAAIARSCAAGALSGLVAGAAEMLHDSWLVVLGVAAAAAVVEILYIYWDTLRAVHRMAHAAGLDLAGDEAVAGALARAALEVPNPARRLFGVDPRRHVSKWRLLLATLVYKAKIGATNIALKFLVRRALTRAALRAWVPMIAVPVTAIWNGVVSWLVLREARLRAMGPSAARALAAGVLDGAGLSVDGRVAAVRAVAAAVVRTGDLHPNLQWLLVEVTRRCGEPADADDVTAFLASLPALPDADRDVVRRLLVAAAIVDGRLTRAERRLLAEAGADLEAAERLRRALRRGDELTA